MFPSERQLNLNSELIGSHWTGYDFTLQFQVVYLLSGIDDNGDPIMSSLEANTEKSVSPRALGTTYLRKWACPHCGRWLGYDHEKDLPCFHESVSKLNKRLFPVC